MASFDTQVLFIPYRGSPGDQKDTRPSTGSISQQKHAAREYHRKAKLRKQSQHSVDRPSSIKRNYSSSDDSRLAASLSRSTSPDDGLSCPTTSTSMTQRSCTPTPSPSSYLGAGRIDPFDSAPVKDLTPHVHHMVDYALNYQWPIFSFVNPTLSYESMKQYMSHRLNISQTSFYTVIYAAATHYALSRVGEEASPMNQMLRLNYKDRALNMLLTDVKATGQEMPIENLAAMFAMSAYGKGTALHIPPMKSRDMKNPLAVTYDLDVYSRIPSEMAHFRALLQTVLQKGGLKSIPRPGFATVIALNDTFLSFRALEPPVFPLVNPRSQYLDTFDCNEFELCTMCRQLQLVVPQLPLSAKLGPLKTLLKDTLLITLAYEQYQSFDQRAPSLRNILMARHCVLHDLLVLGDSQACKIVGDGQLRTEHEDTIYDLAWLSVLSYMVLDLHPLMRGPGPHEELSRRLTTIINQATQAALQVKQLVLFEWANELLKRLLEPCND